MKSKRLLGCSFPVLIILTFIIFGLIILGLLAGPIGKSFGVSLPSWMTLHEPEIKLPAEVVFHIFGFPVTNTLLGTWLTIVVLVLLCWGATRKCKLIPGKLQNVIEYILEYLYNFCKNVAGEKYGRMFFPLVATIFLMVITNAWLSLLPIFGPIMVHTHEGEVHLLRGANTDINMPLAMALVSFFTVEIFGLKTHGIKYLSKFINVGPLYTSLKQISRGKIKSGFSGLITGFINLFVGAIEAISEFARIISLTLRLFGNMTAGEILLLIITFLVPFIVVDVFYVLELLIGFVQAFIFSGLTLVFLTMAVVSHDSEHN